MKTKELVRKPKITQRRSSEPKRAPRARATKAEPVKKELAIPRPDMRMLHAVVRGISPLIMHAWSVKAKKQIEDKQAKAAKTAREVRDPEAEYRAAMYIYSGNLNGKRGKVVYGFPARAFKMAMLDAVRYCEGLTMAYAKGLFFVMGDLLPITTASGPRMREDMVRTPPRTGGANIAYRPEFVDWQITLPIRYDQNLVQPAQLLNLVAISGNNCGVGEWRPSAPMKPGTNGMYEVGEVVDEAVGIAKPRRIKKGKV